MRAFDKVIGYENIKNELFQVCDMVRNPDIYKKLGATMTHGVLLHGEPGVGKTLMANCFIEECGLPAYRIRRSLGGDSFIGEMTETFRTAKENAPSIVFLDDLDKFSNADFRQKDTEEYVAVQAGIDEVSGCDVLVIATANEIRKLPDSLVRPGRFDKVIEVSSADDNDVEAIIRHYLADKKVSDDVNIEDLAKMMHFESCAKLETILNEAAVTAAFRRKDKVEMQDFVETALKMEYRTAESQISVGGEELRKTALHEAGHLVIAEALIPDSVGLASIRSSEMVSELGGFIHRCKKSDKRHQQIMICLGGKVAVELYYSENCASGCPSDLRNATKSIRSGIADNGTHGVEFLDVYAFGSDGMTSQSSYPIEVATRSALERYLFKVRNILIQNRAFLEKVTDALVEKKTLLYSDIQAIKKTVPVKQFYPECPI